jgi:hypothetical protein
VAPNAAQRRAHALALAHRALASRFFALHESRTSARARPALRVSAPPNTPPPTHARAPVTFLLLPALLQW